MTSPGGQAPPAPSARDGISEGEGVKLSLSWLFVGIPALWGIWQVFVKALALFR
jgi:hypothetical protein